MKNKKVNIKIKPRKYTLYGKKKSKGKQVLAGVITVIAAAALCVVGYGIGRPVMDYFRNRQNAPAESSIPWTPTFEETVQSPETEPPTTETAEPTTEAAEETKPVGAYFLPDSACLSSESLNGAIAAAKNNGARAVVVTLKDNMGYLLYKTAVSGVADSDIVTGTLTAKQICDIITKAGLTPAARISTTKDHVGGAYIGGNFIISGDGGSWHDAAVANGGKKWLNPFSDNTVSYIRSLTGEIAAAGFKEIILSNNIFPDFHPSDYTTYLYDEPIGDEAARTEALWKIIDAARTAANANGAELLVEMSAEALYAENKLATNAEAASDAEKLAKVTLLLDYSFENTSYSETKAFIGRTNAALKNSSFAVMIINSSFSAGAGDEVKRAFEEAGVAVYTG